MVLAGAFGGVGVSIKQSGFDGVAALAMWLLLAGLVAWVPWRTVVVRIAWLAAGMAAVVGLVLLHAALSGWSDWWYAIVGYRMEQRSAIVGAEWSRLGRTGPDAAPILVPPIVVAVVAWAWLRRRGSRVFVPPATGVLAAWAVSAALSFVIGGQFFHHYWVIFSFPIAALCGLVIGRLPAPRASAIAAAVALVVPAASFLNLVVLPDDEIPVAISQETRPAAGEAVGHWIDDHATPGDTFYAVCAAAHAYAHAEMTPVYRYLWFDGVRLGHGAQAELRALFEGDDRPTWVATFDRPDRCDPSGTMTRALAQFYVRVDTVSNVTIYRLRD
jgi:hypothetical protein